jgi:hypothetical protein
MSSQVTPTVWNNGWTLFRNERLPPMVTPFWTYDTSWSWFPQQYNAYTPNGDNPSTLTRDYNYYINNEEHSVVHPLITATGGLSEPDVGALEISTLQFPDLKSETRRARTILDQYGQIMARKGLIPARVAY